MDPVTRSRRGGEPYPSAPKPDELRAGLQRITNQLSVLNVEFRWAYEMAHGSNRRGRSEGGGHYAGDPNDPTGNLVSSAQKQRARKACSYAARQVEEAQAALKAAIHSCQQAMRDTHEPAAEPLAMGNLVTRAEKAQSEEAQARRRERGEDVPA